MLQSLQSFAKAEPLPMENDNEKQKIGKKKYKLGQVPQKLLVTILLSIHVVDRTNFLLTLHLLYCNFLIFYRVDDPF